MTCQVVTFDLCEHRYTKPCVQAGRVVRVRFHARCSAVFRRPLLIHGFVSVNVSSLRTAAMFD